jgi:uncharacterized membrane protein YjjP (DUF1212 family)
VLKERAWGAVGAAGFASGIVKALNTNHWWLVLIALFLLAIVSILAVCWAVRHMDADEVRVTKDGITLKRRAIRRRRSRSKLL